MASNFAYMASTKNVPDILAKVRSAGTPPRFTIDFLRTNLGFKSSNDRAIINVLKQLGMLTPSGEPTARYNEFKDPAQSGTVLARGLREGWSEVFLADQQAYERSQQELKGLFQRLSEKSERVSEEMARTFRALADEAEWALAPVGIETEDLDEADVPTVEVAPSAPAALGRLGLHNDIHVHLPPTSDVSVYTAIFRALREELLSG